MPAPARYAVQALITIVRLVLSRPRAVVFMNPPFVAGLVCLGYAWVFHAELWADSHSGAFNDPRWLRFRRIDQWLERRCQGVIVTNRQLATVVARNRARPLVLNYPDPEPRDRAGQAAGYLFATMGYQFDEPISELVSAIRMVPEVEVVFSGRAPQWLVTSAPPNCRFTGWVSRSGYEEMLSAAAGVICLTSREATMQTGAFEAMQFGLPMLLSDTRALRDFFGADGVTYARSHDPFDLAQALRVFNAHQACLRTKAEVARLKWLGTCRAELSVVNEAMAG